MAKHGIMFHTSYFDRGIFNLEAVLRNGEKHLADLDFDTMIGTGFSGGVIIPALALRLDKMWALVRKDNDNSHHGAGEILGEIGQRWLFVDDFVSSGHTRNRVVTKVSEACSDRGHFPTYVGDYLYQSYNDDCLFGRLSLCTQLPSMKENER
jgi:adenine/guanine phosphoribosyltransferase-like PRPP-binding protein